ncbi:hypothetical protein ACMHYO_19185 [Allopusillimonas ginsengisoli]|uniref:hypothetical protein n=1 Tax=Allopusillimonas ginsengisoli TaxID=453575 RepID=UPI0039C2F581
MGLIRSGIPPIVCVFASIAAQNTATASCSISGTVETCTGSVTGGAIVHTQSEVHKLTLSALANTIDAADSTDAGKKTGPVISLKHPGGVTPAPADWSSSNRNGQAGVDGSSGSALSATVSLDSGYGLTGQSGIWLESYGWDGSQAHEAKHTDKHATGGKGGDGGTGGNLSLIAASAGGGKPVAAIKASSSAPASTGILLVSGGGEGGAGGWAHSSGGLKDAQGGTGGQGGAAGSAVLQLSDGHNLSYSGAGLGIAINAQGGNGGAGGYGEVDGLDADSSYGGAGGTGGQGGSIKVTATSAVSTIVTSGLAGIALQSMGGNGGIGGEGKGGHDHAGDGGNAGNGGDINANFSSSVTTSGSSGYGVYVKSAGGFAGDSGDDSGGIKNHAGNPGEPGQAGSVTLGLTSSRIDTSNTSADGIFVQSIGGMGSGGGSSSGLFSYGSKGGSGGAGGQVMVTLDKTTVTTSGNHAKALLIQSIGGAGGKAGSTSGITALAAAAGAGGTGGAVDVALTDTTLQTKGLHSTGVLVQSNGGGGGSSGSATGIYAVGGAGGLGGAAGAVKLSLDTVQITTQGDDSLGISLQSIGAGGGESHSPQGLIALGQNGGGGGNGSAITYASNGGGVSIATSGDVSDAILLHSIGGGGGHGGSTFEAFANFSSQVGATGGGGGSGGDVTYVGNDDDAISTTGDQARGLVLQTIGGGGGSGGNIIKISTGLTFGGHTGSSGSSTEHHGGTLTADIAGKVTTSGDSATGVLAQSIGGGGGSAGSSVSVSVGLTLGHSQGSSGAAGGHGGLVTLTSSADISTGGTDADGILAQSIGGGGGHTSTVVNATVGGSIKGLNSQQGASGGAGGDGYDVTVTSAGDIKTVGDKALGVAAQSIAGGGGKAGSTISATVGPDIGSTTVGQSGGTGGNAGKVSITSQGDVVTQGDSASAVFAQSIGKGGGQGGLTINGDVSGISANVTQGGSGGKAGAGGAVSVDNSGWLTTSGDSAVGIFAQSLGGSGGDAGMTVHGAFSVVTLSSNLGGNGGDGGTASTVKVNNAGGVSTSGNKATAIFAQSLGGSGGKAGTLVNGTATGGEVSDALALSVGGSGGNGGNASDVEVDQLVGTLVTTTGHDANGITAQSIGGDGGSGGNVWSGSLAVSESGSLNVNISVGGAGGDGGKAGKATIMNASNISTTGADSEAIFAQSIGGNGGDAGSSYAITVDGSAGTKIESTISVGGSGGSGAVASSVQVNNAGVLSTVGGNAAGIYAQSIGGNGGVGGQGLVAFGDFEATSENYVSIKADVEVGGAGGAGSHAGSVNVVNSGSITTASDTSAGIWAQAVGGGGGDGGNAGAYTIGYLKSLATGNEEPEKKGLALSVTVGGGGGGGGNGGALTASNTKTISTAGAASYGIFAQSIGGGGGSGGNGSPGLEGWIADIYEDYEKLGQWKEIYEQYQKVRKKDWKGLFLESFSVDVGGSAGGTGDGGTVSVSNNGTIITSGDSATALYAQSVGGGGGNGGDGSQGMLTSVTVTGSVGGGGKGGAVTVDNQGVIQTSGAGAMGIYAQSVGGGGGSAGDVEGTLATNLSALDEILGYNIFGSTGGSAGSGGDGGNVTITSAGSIVTTGVNAHGIWAQSVGGGGGAASSYGNGFGDSGVGSDGLSGSSGHVSLKVTGDISVSGDGAHGIFLQSASGVGTTSRAGGIDLTVSGSVTAAGANSRAILAQAASYAEDTSTSDPSAGTVTITINKGATVATTNAASFETIAIKGGRSVMGSSGYLVSNQFINAGTLISAGPDAVVLATDDKAGLLVNNNGIVSGSVSGGSEHAIKFYNGTDGDFALGTQVNLGTNSGALLSNQGILSAGGSGVIGASRVTTGSFTQGSLGKIHVDLSKSNADTPLSNDRIMLDVGGRSNAISLAGSVRPYWVGGTTFQSGETGRFRILETANGEAIDSRGVALTNTATVAYMPRPIGGESALEADYKIDYSGKASGVKLGEIARDFANYFSAAMGTLRHAEGLVGTSRTMSLFATELLNTTSGEVLARTYGEHTLDENSIGVARAASASLALHSLLQSCPKLDRAVAGTDFFRERECAWMQLQGGKHRQDATGSMPDFNESSTGIAGAVQNRVGKDTFIEVGGRLEKVDVRGDNFSDDGHRFSLGVAVKREIGIFTLSSTFGGGLYYYDKERAYSLGGTRHRATSDTSGNFVTIEGRISALLPQNNFYIKPAFAVSATRVKQNGYSESGSGPLNWHVNSISKTAVGLSTSVEVGYAFNVSDHPAAAYARAGLNSSLSNSGINIVSHLVGDGAALGDLRVTPKTDKSQFELTGGIDIDLGRNLSVSVQGQTALSKNATNYGGYARVKYRF